MARWAVAMMRRDSALPAAAAARIAEAPPYGAPRTSVLAVESAPYSFICSEMRSASGSLDTTRRTSSLALLWKSCSMHRSTASTTLGGLAARN